MAVNKFEELRKQVQEELQRYDAVCEQYKGCHSDPKKANMAHYESIHQLAKPFIDGKFTLAIVGKMSSGKSTFINALIGEQILPTGHFQTTSAITYIERGEKTMMRVTFKDDSYKEFVGNDGIQMALKEFSALKEEFRFLPVNHVDTLICGGKSTEDIIKLKANLEVISKRKIDENILLKYCDTHDISNIVKEIRIWVPMDERFEGWQIIDTPGVSAIGGIQDCTIQILSEDLDRRGNKVVDAIIFLQSGADNSEDKANVDFVYEIFEKLPPSVKERIFFVLTHSSEQKFRNDKDNIIQNFKEIYSDVIANKQNRFCYVDSLLHLFLKDAHNNKIDFLSFNKIKGLPNWDEKVLKTVKSLYSSVEDDLEEEGKEVNSENIEGKLREWSNFETLLNYINEFADKEKYKTVSNIYEKIRISYGVYFKKLSERLSILEGHIDLELKKDEFEKKRENYKQSLLYLQTLGTDDNIRKYFDFIDDSISQFSATDISKCRADYLTMKDEIHKAEKRLFDDLKKSFMDSNVDLTDDVVLESIDFDDIEEKATKDNTKYYKWIDKGVFSTDYVKTRVYTDTEHAKAEIDEVQKARDFKAYVIKEIGSLKKDFYEGIDAKVNSFLYGVNDDINNKITNAINELNDIEKKIEDRDAEICKLKDIRSKIFEANFYITNIE